MKLELSIKPEDMKMFALFGLDEPYLNELSTQIGVAADKICPEMLIKIIKICVNGSEFVSVLRDKDYNPRAIFAISKSGAISFVEAKGVKPYTRAIWARENKDILNNLKTIIGVEPWCYSDSRNKKANRLLSWFKMKHIPERDILINGVLFKYYEHVSVAE